MRAATATLNWPTPEQIAAVLTPVETSWSLSLPWWLVIGGLAAVMAAAIIIGIRRCRRSTGKPRSNPFQLAACCLFLAVGIAAIVGRHVTPIEDRHDGQVAAATLLAEPLDAAHPGWLVSVPTERGERHFIVVQRGVIRFAALDTNARMHFCAVTSLETTIKSGIGPDGPTTLSTSNGEVTCELSRR